MLAVLDFWVGRWSVRTRDGEHAGVDVVERALGGRAFLEHWRGADGGEGESLFFLDGHAGTWRQVWATADHHKEKTLELAEPGRVRFAGTLHAGGRVTPDRTTLTALPDGRVGQLIEHSLDGGATWLASFDAIYERSAQSPPSTRATDFRPRGN